MKHANRLIKPSACNITKTNAEHFEYVFNNQLTLQCIS